jgi:hypothetical protein
MRSAHHYRFDCRSSHWRFRTTTVTALAGTWHGHRHALNIARTERGSWIPRGELPQEMADRSRPVDYDLAV